MVKYHIFIILRNFELIKPLEKGFIVSREVYTYFSNKLYYVNAYFRFSLTRFRYSTGLRKSVQENFKVIFYITTHLISVI